MKDVKTCIITGAGSGLGKALAKSLANKGYHLVLIDNDENSLKSVRDEIISLPDNSTVENYSVDLSLQYEIRKFCNEFNNRYRKLDLLINNAGANIPFRKVTAEGIEYMLAVNYLAPFLLTSLLFDKLKLAGNAKIINIGSNGEKYAHPGFDNLQGEKSFSSMRQYCLTKLCLLMFTYHLSKNTGFKDIAICCIHPGGVKTRLMNHYSWHNMPKMAWHVLYPFLKSTGKAAGYVLNLIDMKATAINGKYFSKGRKAISSAVSRDEEIASRLWHHTWTLVNNGF
ncbi:MAG: SDR family NAD(P)-dependent oxidoreductase [Bacteroidales bacterium]